MARPSSPGMAFTSATSVESLASSDGGRRDRRIIVTSGPVTRPTSPARSTNASSPRRWDFHAVRAAMMRPAKHTREPRPLVPEAAATATASRRLRGPSASESSARRMAPVKTTGVGPSRMRSARKAVYSRVLVPWATTTPSIDASRAVSRAASAICIICVGSRRQLATRLTSMTWRSTPGVSTRALTSIASRAA